MRSGVFYSVLCGVVFIATNAHGAEYESVTIRVGAEADAVELKVAELLRQRIAEPSDLPTHVERTAGAGAKNSLLILLGIPAHHPELQKQLEADQIPALTQRDPGPEGFLVKMLADDNVLMAAGVDQRGVLYAAGEILRQLEIKENSVEVPRRTRSTHGTCF